MESWCSRLAHYMDAVYLRGDWQQDGAGLLPCASASLVPHTRKLLQRDFNNGAGNSAAGASDTGGNHNYGNGYQGGNGHQGDKHSEHLLHAPYVT